MTQVECLCLSLEGFQRQHTTQGEKLTGQEGWFTPALSTFKFN
jgi:hypothetical protein